MGIFKTFGRPLGGVMFSTFRALLAFTIAAIGSGFPASAETVGIFYDSGSGQAVFAANEIKNTLTGRAFTVELSDLTKLTAGYPNKKIVITLVSNASAIAQMVSEGGTAASGLGEQAYALRTTAAPQKSYWILGGDANGAMYGGLQIAENLKSGSFLETYSSQESPYILKRGIKLNLPMDLRSPTYSGNNNGTSHQNAIPNTWDLSFWTSWFDEMARNRYNVVSVWTDHPFTAMVKMPDYPNAALTDVQGYNGFSKAMTIDQKIAFWKQIMAYAHSRGFGFYLINWNIYTHGATGKYGIDDDIANAATKTYMRKCMTSLLETYPDLDGFGVTAGENMGTATDGQKEQWLWDTYGQGMLDYAQANPSRKLHFIHRFHQTTPADIAAKFKPLMDLPNVTLDMSYKYSQAHLYATVKPTWITTIDGNIPAQLAQYNLKTWLTVRNDDFYYLHWGDPVFARAYLQGLPDKDKYIAGFYIGSDGFAPTRVFFSKDKLYQGDLEVRRLWYTQMIWGRLAFNPATPDGIFKNQMSERYPQVSSPALFTAWSKASQSLPRVTELVHGKFLLDFDWWIEGCQSSSGFRTIDDFAGAPPGNGSSLCSIAKTASNSCGSAKTSLQLADEIESDASSALTAVNGMASAGNEELAINLKNLKAMSYLSLYYASKIRGATYKGTQIVSARGAMSKAYCYWHAYTGVMDATYAGMKMQRVDDFPDWQTQDAPVLSEYTKLGGVGIPDCSTVSIAAADKPAAGSIRSLARNLVVFRLPGGRQYRIRIFNNSGRKLAEASGTSFSSGTTRASLENPLAPGLYFVKLTSNKIELVGRFIRD